MTKEEEAQFRSGERVDFFAHDKWHRGTIERYAPGADEKVNAYFRPDGTIRLDGAPIVLFPFSASRLRRIDPLEELALLEDPCPRKQEKLNPESASGSGVRSGRSS